MKLQIKLQLTFLLLCPIAKILLCDSRYAICGSANWLSYTGYHNREVSVKITDKKTNTNDYKKYFFSINAADNEGIIYVLSNLFKKHNINIISMDTFVKNAPVTGSPIFYLDSILHKEELCFPLIGEKS